MKLRDWHDLEFSAFQGEVKRIWHTVIPVRERNGWEQYLTEKTARVRELMTEIKAAEREIDRVVYAAFDLSPEEVANIERSIEGQV
jgi:hypothetical protein